MLLNIITVYRFGNEPDLIRTIDSVNSQSNLINIRHVLVLSNATTEHIEMVSERSLARNLIIANQDRSLYDAMNIGLTKVRTGFILFLNGGDIFSSKEAGRLISEQSSSCSPTLFSTLQVYKNDAYLRPGGGDFSRHFPAHQGFIIPKSLVENNFFDLSSPIAADHFWMTNLISRYGCTFKEPVITAFMLGGVSNSPTVETVKSRYFRQGTIRALVEISKFLIKKLLGPKLFYRLIFFNKYKRIYFRAEW